MNNKPDDIVAKKILDELFKEKLLFEDKKEKRKETESHQNELQMKRNDLFNID